MGTNLGTLCIINKTLKIRSNFKANTYRNYPVKLIKILIFRQSLNKFSLLIKLLAYSNAENVLIRLINFDICPYRG